MQGAKPRSPQRHCRKHPRFSTPCGKDCGLFPAFSQPVENYVEKHGMHSRMQTPQTANPGIAAEKHAPRSPVDMHKNTDGQMPQANRKPPPDVHKYRWTEPPAFPQKTEKIRPQRPVCRGRNAAGHPKIPPKPPPDADFHNPSRQNPDIPHRTAPAKTPKSSCRGWIFRFSTVPRPLLLLLLDGRIEGWTDRARARGRRKAGRR